MLSKQEVGARGEQLAADFLIQKGYRIITRNLRLKIGEIDILAQDADCIVVVEVKTVSHKGVIDPLWKVVGVKRRKLQVLARVVAARYSEKNIRIDVITVCGSTLQHIENV